ncbi:MAG: hypothetical protein QF790_04970 [Gammaproteobacteria bacterium]|nr:hypothetical protein [Gammaproteobacteria bacterium]
MLFLVNMRRLLIPFIAALLACVVSLPMLAEPTLPRGLQAVEVDNPANDAPPVVRPAPSADSVSRAIVAQERHTDALMKRPGIQGTAVGWGPDGEAVIKIYRSSAASAAGLPETIDGIPVVIEDVGKIYAQYIPCADREEGSCGDLAASADPEPGPREWQPRPVPIGVSAGHVDITAGTLGCRVTSGCHTYALSNAHVFADENAGQVGDNILQPGPYDGGIDPDDQIGLLHNSIPISFTSPNVVDAAIALTSDAMVGDSTLSNGYGRPRAATISAVVSMDVMKYGRTTGMTHGYIDAINASVGVEYSSDDALFVNQIIIKPDTGPDFSRPGDSGALVVVDGGSNDRRPVGLLFAAGTGITVANPIALVTTALGVIIDGD